MTKDSRRLRRQFEALSRSIPASRPVSERLLQDHMRLVRLPVAGLLILGGCLSFLPVLGIWMLPLGLLLLAVDVPQLRPTVTGSMIRARRRLSIFWRERVRRRRGRRARLPLTAPLTPAAGSAAAGSAGCPRGPEPRSESRES